MIGRERRGILIRRGSILRRSAVLVMPAMAMLAADQGVVRGRVLRGTSMRDEMMPRRHDHAHPQVGGQRRQGHKSRHTPEHGSLCGDKEKTGFNGSILRPANSNRKEKTVRTERIRNSAGLSQSAARQLYHWLRQCSSSISHRPCCRVSCHEPSSSLLVQKFHIAGRTGRALAKPVAHGGGGMKLTLSEKHIPEINRGVFFLCREHGPCTDYGEKPSSRCWPQSS